MLQAVPVFVGLKVGLSQSASLNIAGGSAKPGQVRPRYCIVLQSMLSML